MLGEFESRISGVGPCECCAILIGEKVNGEGLHSVQVHGLHV